eukprot:NODE_212_length_14557_cov_0.357103.p8 type:complete len:150 gc:universal NODE_212_length_14557_cov_0.357103:10028-9579(-)
MHMFSILIALTSANALMNASIMWITLGDELAQYMENGAHVYLYGNSTSYSDTAYFSVKLVKSSPYIEVVVPYNPVIFYVAVIDSKNEKRYNASGKPIKGSTNAVGALDLSKLKETYTNDVKNKYSIHGFDSRVNYDSKAFPVSVAYISI